MPRLTLTKTPGNLNTATRSMQNITFNFKALFDWIENKSFHHCNLDPKPWNWCQNFVFALPTPTYKRLWSENWVLQWGENAPPHLCRSDNTVGETVFIRGALQLVRGVTGAAHQCLTQSASSSALDKAKGLSITYPVSRGHLKVFLGKRTGKKCLKSVILWLKSLSGAYYNNLNAEH